MRSTPAWRFARDGALVSLLGRAHAPGGVPARKRRSRRVGYVQALLGFQRRRARRLGVRDGQSGCLTVIQRFGGALNLNIHFHTLVLDGVFTSALDAVQFQFTLPPGIPAGTYLVFAAFLRQDALNNNQIDPGDVLAASTKAFTFTE